MLWIYAPDTTDRQALVTLLGQIFYQDDQEPRATHTLPGIVGSSLNTIRLANRLNAAKTHLGQALRAMDQYTIRQLNSDTGRWRQIRLSDTVLPSQGLARLHRHQCYRHLRSLQSRPGKVSLSWAHTRCVQATTAGEIREELERMRRRTGDAFNLNADLELISRWRDTTRLARVRPGALHARANLLWESRAEGLQRRQMTLALPLLFPATANLPLPELKPLSNASAAPRRQRHSDRRLSDSPCLRTLPVYLYK